MPLPPCPICKKPVRPRDENPAFPFCAERCRLIDLGNWLGESYRVPVAPDEDEDGGALTLPADGPRAGKAPDPRGGEGGPH